MNRVLKKIWRKKTPTQKQLLADFKEVVGEKYVLKPTSVGVHNFKANYHKVLQAHDVFELERYVSSYFFPKTLQTEGERLVDNYSQKKVAGRLPKKTLHASPAAAEEEFPEELLLKKSIDFVDAASASVPENIPQATRTEMPDNQIEQKTLETSSIAVVNVPAQKKYFADVVDMLRKGMETISSFHRFFYNHKKSDTALEAEDELIKEERLNADSCSRRMLADEGSSIVHADVANSFSDLSDEKEFAMNARDESAISEIYTEADILNATLSLHSNPSRVFASLAALQIHFKLSLDEAISLHPHQADRGAYLKIGGREIPIECSVQRQLFDDIKKYAGKGRLRKTESTAAFKAQYYAELKKQGVVQNPEVFVQEARLLPLGKQASKSSMTVPVCYAAIAKNDGMIYAFAFALQYLFGLTVSECASFEYQKHVQGERLCFSGRERAIDIKTDQQKQLIALMREHIGNSRLRRSLDVEDFKTSYYIALQQRNIFDLKKYFNEQGSSTFESSILGASPVSKLSIFSATEREVETRSPLSFQPSP